jgi:hypothetical protein
MSYADHARNLKLAIEELTASRVENTQIIMNDMVALMKQRMIETGNIVGRGPQQYSRAEFPYWLFAKSIKNYKKNATPREGYYAAFNPEIKKKELYKKTGYWASYPEWREVTARPIAFINFSFTQQMWGAVQPLMISENMTGVTFEVWAEQSEKDAIDKLNWNIARHGNILAFSKEEKDITSKLNRQRIFKVLVKHKLA